MWFKVIPFAILLLSCQFLFSQETKPKNPILTDKFIISAGLYSPLNNVSFSVNGTAIDRESEDIDFDEYFNLDDFQKQIKDAVTRYVKDTVTNAPAAHNIPVIQIESKTAQINDAIEYDIGKRLKENFGVIVSGVDIGSP